MRRPTTGGRARPRLGIFSRFAEYLTLRDAAATAARIPRETRETAADVLARSAQMARSSQSLWAEGHTAEGLRLGAESFDLSLEAASTLAAALDPSPSPAGASTPSSTPANTDPGPEGAVAKAAATSEPVPEGAVEKAAAAGASEQGGADVAAADETAAATSEPVPEGAVEKAAAAGASEQGGADVAAAGDFRALLLHRGLRPKRIERIARLAERRAREPLPEFDKKVAPVHAVLLRDLGRSSRAVRVAATPLSRTGRGLLALLLTRWLFVLMPLLVLGGIAAVAFQSPPRIHATASAHYENRSRFAPDRAVDGNTVTEWLLPNKSAGWIDLELDPPRRVDRIGILNAVNGEHRDRATKAYRIEVYARGRRIRSINGSFTGLQTRRAERERIVYLGVSRIEKIRVHVLSWSGKGAGIAEITVD